MNLLIANLAENNNMMLNMAKDKYFKMLMDRNLCIKASIDRYKNRKHRNLNEGDQNSKIAKEQQINVKSIDKYIITNSGHVSDNDSYFDYKSDLSVKDIDITLHRHNIDITLHRHIDLKSKSVKLTHFLSLDKISHKIDSDDELNKKVLFNSISHTTRI